MIISHKYKFIFIKTAKTAGTSIEIALSKFCGPDDIITPISPEDEEIRRKLGYPGPQHFFLPTVDFSARDSLNVASQQARKFRFYNHMPAKDVKTVIGQQAWDNYYKFCFERNPWDRIVSIYYYRHFKSGSHPTISEFIHSLTPLMIGSKGYDLYTIDGKIAVDKVCKFENISEELEVIRKQLGIPEKLDLPKAKSRFRKDKRSYRDILGEVDRVRVAELFYKEINLFGYEFHGDGQRQWSSPSVHFVGRNGANR